MNNKVTGIGGVFMKCNNPSASREWYSKHLGFNNDQYGTTFEWRYADAPERKGQTVWSTFAKDSNYFGKPEQQFMLNLRVDNLEWLLGELKNEGIEQVGEMQVFDYGKFAHIIDLDGNKIELWESIDEAAEEMVKDATTK